MSVRIGSNISSLKALRQHAYAASEISSVYERLSSGLRINKASDDAAGLSVLSSLNADKRVFNQGIRNFNDGISLLNIADGALNELTNITTRLKELAEQAANGVYGVMQRKALDAEAQALSKEYFRIERSTTFNGRGLFFSEFGQLRVQGGYGTDGGIQSGLGGAIGNGTFAAAATYAVQNSSYITSGDFNGDGITDIASISGTDDTLSVLLGTGNGSFGNAVSFSISSNPAGSYIKSADFNNDGILDLAIDQSGDLGIMLGNGNGTFQTAVSFATTGGSDIGVADFNNDGSLDVVLASGNTEALVLLGRGNGTFGAETIYSTGDESDYLTVGDFNNDGIYDFATTAENDDDIVVSIGRGDGTFASGRTYYAGFSGPNQIHTADLNNDGNLDFVVNPKSSGQSVSVVFGYGDGTFAASRTYAFGANINESALGDFNGDGNIDISIVSGVANKVMTMLGNGDGTFGAATSFATSTAHLQILTGDLNGDGVVDIAAASTASDNISLFLGNAVDGVSPLLPFSLRTRADALQSLSIFDQKLSQLSQHRGKIGAFQARINTGISTLESSSENYAAAAGRIRDADVAHESSRMIRLGILQKAASSVLAQANQQPALALVLLKD